MGTRTSQGQSDRDLHPEVETCWHPPLNSLTWKCRWSILLGHLHQKSVRFSIATQEWRYVAGAGGGESKDGAKASQFLTTAVHLQPRQEPVPLWQCCMKHQAPSHWQSGHLGQWYLLCDCFGIHAKSHPTFTTAVPHPGKVLTYLKAHETTAREQEGKEGVVWGPNSVVVIDHEINSGHFRHFPVHL